MGDTVPQPTLAQVWSDLTVPEREALVEVARMLLSVREGNLAGNVRRLWELVAAYDREVPRAGEEDWPPHETP